MEKAQETDPKSRDRRLKEGDKVLVLLPTSTNKLLAALLVQWRISDVNCQIDFGSKKRKRFHVFHINNMLHLRYETNGLMQEEVKEVNADEEPEPDMPRYSVR